MTYSRFEPEGQISEYPGNYSAYLERKKAEEISIKETEKQAESKEDIPKTQN